MSLPTIRVVAAVIERDGAYLITQRRTTATLALLWEFPGGRVEPDETDEEALVRELRHRLEAEITCGKLISFVSHPYEKYVVDLYLYECTLASEHLAKKNVQDFRWVKSEAFESIAFTPADESSMNQLLGVDKKGLA